MVLSASYSKSPCSPTLSRSCPFSGGHRHLGPESDVAGHRRRAVREQSQQILPRAPVEYALSVTVLPLPPPPGEPAILTLATIVVRPRMRGDRVERATSPFRPSTTARKSVLTYTVFGARDFKVRDVGFAAHLHMPQHAAELSRAEKVPAIR